MIIIKITTATTTIIIIRPRRYDEEEEKQEVEQDEQEDSEAQSHKMFQRTLFIRTKHNMRIFSVISFIKLQNDT